MPRHGHRHPTSPPPRHASTLRRATRLWLPLLPQLDSDDAAQTQSALRGMCLPRLPDWSPWVPLLQHHHAMRLHVSPRRVRRALPVPRQASASCSTSTTAGLQRHRHDPCPSITPEARRAATWQPAPGDRPPRRRRQPAPGRRPPR